MDRLYMPPPKPAAYYADDVHDRIEKQINDAAEDLKEGQSILVEVVLNDGRVIIPTYFGYHNPVFIVVYGKDANGNEMKALVPYMNI
jgi:hypothetical protein